MGLFWADMWVRCGKWGSLELIKYNLSYMSQVGQMGLIWADCICSEAEFL